MRNAGSWRVAYRWARRDLRRSWARNLLVATMVGMPVLLVSGFATIFETDNLTPTEATASQMGTTQASVRGVSRSPIQQSPDENWYSPTDSGDPVKRWTAAEVQRATGGTVLEVSETNTSVRTERGRLSASVAALDLADPRLDGLVQLRSGRLPRTQTEVLISPELSSRHLAVGDSVGLGKDERRVTITGTAVMVGSYNGSTIVGLPGVLPPSAPASGEQADERGDVRFLVDRPSPVGWTEVRALNELGLVVASKAVRADPPQDWQSTVANPEQLDYGMGGSGDAAVVVIVVVAIVIEVVLMAGPAFAVGVRRQRRQLALLAAAGGTDRHVRRVVLAQALLTGAASALAGAALSVPGAWLLMFAVVRIRPGTVFGPFDIAWTPLLAALALGVLAALAAAFFPARSVARQDVVQVLAGRRGQLRSHRGLPVLGLAMMGLGAGIALTLGTRQGGELMVAVATIAMVLGAIALMPGVIGLVGRLGARLPLPLRLATRDSARQRSRTAPAVAAVMAAVAGVTALAVGSASDFEQSRKEYTPQYPAGVTVVEADSADRAWWASTAQTVEAAVPGRQLRPISRLVPPTPNRNDLELATYIAPPGCPSTPPNGEESPERCVDWMFDGQQQGQYSSYQSLVTDAQALAVLGYQLDDKQRAVLDGGGVLVPGSSLVDASGHATLVTYSDAPSQGQAQISHLQKDRLRAAYLAPLPSDGVVTFVGAVMTPDTAQKLGLRVSQSRAVLSASDTPLSRQVQKDLEEKLAGTTSYVNVYTERGFDQKFTVAFIGLAVLGGLVVLTGTLTATGLALADSRPDLATLAAVGARPRTRRAMAAAQALVIGLLGALSGIVVGMVPGLAVTWPLTAATHDPKTGQSMWGSPTITVPWLLLLAVGVAVPLIAALSAGLGVRSRLPLVRRIAQ